MSQEYKPAGYNSASPYLIVDGAESTIAFLKDVFGGIELRRFAGDQGRLMHAEVRIDDSVVMLADGAPGEWPAMPAHVHIYVTDVDATYRRAVAAGAASVQEPVKKEDEDKRASGVTVLDRRDWPSPRRGRPAPVARRFAT